MKVIRIKFTREKDGTYIAANSFVKDVFSIGEDKEEALNNLCLDLIDYAHDFATDYDIYSIAPNRREHIPFIIRILSAPTIDAVKQMLTIE